MLEDIAKPVAGHSSSLMPMIFVHVHYPDIWEEMAHEIALLCDIPFGLVLTHSGHASLARPQTPHLAYYKEIVTDNRGRDVLPFLQALRSDLPSFDIGLKLHTKRSPHRDDGAQWRQFLTASLLEHFAKGQGPDAYQLLRAEPRIGLVAPRGHLMPLLGRVALNGPAMARMLDVLGITMPLSELDNHHFAASTMFWFRREALSLFLKPELDALFEPEASQLDGTAAHAAERLFALVCEQQGYLATAVEVVEPILSAMGEAGEALSSATLKEIFARTCREADNPFSMPLASFWVRHRRLLKLAHLAYQHVPPPVWRHMRRFIRWSTRRNTSNNIAA